VKESDVIVRVVSGDVESFRSIVARYQKPIIRFVRNLVDDSHVCEDIAQEVFLTAYKMLGSFNPERSEFSTWLFAIARNKSLNVLKKKRPLSMCRLPERTSSGKPSDVMTQKEFFDELDRALQGLPVAQKTAFVLAELEQLSHAEIAQIEGVRIGTVKSRINRAKSKLRSALKNLDGETS
jgi:RNA polymerase sigma-70 factor (ECF subfamily)